MRVDRSRRKRLCNRPDSIVELSVAIQGPCEGALRREVAAQFEVLSSPPDCLRSIFAYIRIEIDEMVIVVHVTHSRRLEISRQRLVLEGLRLIRLSNECVQLPQRLVKLGTRHAFDNLF